jgi:hypothetical protein
MVSKKKAFLLRSGNKSDMKKNKTDTSWFPSSVQILTSCQNFHEAALVKLPTMWYIFFKCKG